MAEQPPGAPDPATPGRYVLAGVPRKHADDLTIVDAQGSWVTLASGQRLLDLNGQHMCIGVGHRHPRMVAALHRAVDGLGYAADFAAHSAKSDAATLLVETTIGEVGPAGAVRFVCSGSEATEMALLLARLYTNRPVVVTRDLGFHGWTSGASAATGIAPLRNMFIDLDSREARAVPSPHAPYPAAPAPLCANCPLGRTYPGCKDDRGVLACVSATERLIRSVGVEQVAAFVTEIWHGAGAFLAPDEYAPQVRDMTSRLGVLWIDDEAIGGPARTGRWWAFQHGGVRPDIVTVAKGITSAAVPAGACVVSREIADFMDTGVWTHSSTFSGHPLAMAAIAANITIIVEEGLVERAGQLGDLVQSRLREIVERHPSVAGFTGRGLLWGLELVRAPATGRRWVEADRWHSWTADKRAFWPATYVSSECRKREVLLVDYAPNTVTVAPSLTITEAELDLGLSTIDEVLVDLDQRVESGVGVVGH
jgi:taurine--2-oxoglutarate transaminase